MPAVKLYLKTLSSAVAVAAAVAVWSPSPAWAVKGGHKERGSVQEKGNTGAGKASATAGGVQFDYSKNPRTQGGGQVTPMSNWTPPACWYAPKWTPEQAAQDRLGLDFSPNHDQGNAETYRKAYIDGKYKNFNVKNQGKGYWWGSYQNPDRLDDAGVDACTKLPFWVDKGAQPPADVPNAVTPEVLAQLAYTEIEIPQGKASMAPADGDQVVNLPTWVWLNNADFHPVSVTARVDALNIQATTTATPVSMHIDAGTADAQTYPAGGDCPIHDGRIGTERPPGAKGDPPAGWSICVRRTARVPTGSRPPLPGRSVGSARTTPTPPSCRTVPTELRRT